MSIARASLLPLSLEGNAIWSVRGEMWRKLLGRERSQPWEGKEKQSEGEEEKLRRKAADFHL